MAAVLVIEVVTVLVGDTVVMLAEDPSDVNPDVAGEAQIIATITGMLSVVKDKVRGEK